MSNFDVDVPNFDSAAPTLRPSGNRKRIAAQDQERNQPTDGRSASVSTPRSSASTASASFPPTERS
jgi:hypothetical protein